jgi:hypothetical protein
MAVTTLVIFHFMFAGMSGQGVRAIFLERTPLISKPNSEHAAALGERE